MRTKGHIIWTTILTILFFISCDKEELKIDEYWGEMTANKNSVSWESLPKAGISNITDDLFINSNTYSEEGYHRELLSFYKIPLPLTKGEYKLEMTGARDIDDKIGAQLITSTDDGDVTGDIYNISELDTTSVLRITKIDGDEIWGTFSVILLRDTTRFRNVGVPDTLFFLDGEFHTKILD